LLRQQIVFKKKKENRFVVWHIAAGDRAFRGFVWHIAEGDRAFRVLCFGERFLGERPPKSLHGAPEVQ